MKHSPVVDGIGRIWYSAYVKNGDRWSYAAICLHGSQVVERLPGKLLPLAATPDDGMLLIEAYRGRLWLVQGDTQRVVTLAGTFRDPNRRVDAAFDSRGRLWLNSGCGLLLMEGVLNPDQEFKVRAHYTRGAPPVGHLFFDKYGACWVVANQPHRAYRMELRRLPSCPAPWRRRGT